MITDNKLTAAQLRYCSQICPKGKRIKQTCLSINNSAIDAAIDMWEFTANCAKSCNIIKSQEDGFDNKTNT